MLKSLSGKTMRNPTRKLHFPGSQRSEIAWYKVSTAITGIVFPNAREDPKVEPPNSGLQCSSGVDCRTPRWIYFLDPPRALGVGPNTSSQVACHSESHRSGRQLCLLVDEIGSWRAEVATGSELKLHIDLCTCAHVNVHL